MAGLDVEFHLDLWARLARQGVDVGYYKNQPWYNPALAGYRESYMEPSDEDCDMAERVGRIVLKIQQKDPKRGQIVRLYYGAYPEAQQVSKGDRIRFISRELGIRKGEMFREIQAAKHQIEGAIELA